MDRRKALKYAAAATGITLSGAFVSGFLSSCGPEAATSGYLPKFFTKDQFSILKTLADGLIPKTDTPGAVELGVPEWLDGLISDTYSDDNQQAFRKTFTSIEGMVKPTMKSADLQQLESTLTTESDQKNHYLQVKGMIASAYLGTEYVGENLLEYLPIPGEYEGCTSFDMETGKAWSI